VLLVELDANTPPDGSIAMLFEQPTDETPAERPMKMLLDVLVAAYPELYPRATTAAEFDISDPALYPTAVFW
jgi:hypothetical protein